MSEHVSEGGWGSQNTVSGISTVTDIVKGNTLTQSAFVASLAAAARPDPNFQSQHHTAIPGIAPGKNIHIS